MRVAPSLQRVLGTFFDPTAHHERDRWVPQCNNSERGTPGLRRDVARPGVVLGLVLASRGVRLRPTVYAAAINVSATG